MMVSAMATNEFDNKLISALSPPWPKLECSCRLMDTLDDPCH